MPYRLINARPSPYGRKVAIALIEKGIAFDVDFDEPWGEASCTGRYSPLEQLPILLTPAGEAVYDSVYILDWLEIVHPAPALLPEGTAERLAAMRLRMLGERLMEIAQLLIFELHRADPSSAWIDRQTRKILGGLVALEGHLTASPLPHASIHLGHIAIGTTLLVWDFVLAKGISPPIEALRWQDGPYPAVHTLMAMLAERPSFLRTAPEPMPLDIGGSLIKP